MEYLVEIYHFKSSGWVRNGNDQIVRIIEDTKQKAHKTAEMWYDNKKEVRSITITPIDTKNKVRWRNHRKYIDLTELS